MKNFLKITFILIFLSLNFLCFSQVKYKFGHINTSLLISTMPERDAAEKALSQEAKTMEDQLESMKMELNNKYQAYLLKRDSLSTLVKQTKEAELQDLQTRIEDFQSKAQQQLQQKEQELLKPIIDKYKKAIAEVAKENGFTYVFDIGNNSSVLYFSEESKDILPMVKAKLNLK
jgi:outer membrane protein